MVKIDKKGENEAEFLDFTPKTGCFKNTNGTDERTPFRADIWVLNMATDVNTTMMQQNGSYHRSIFMPTGLCTSLQTVAECL